MRPNPRDQNWDQTFETEARRLRSRSMLWGKCQNFGLKALKSLFISECSCNLQLNTALETGKFWHVEDMASFLLQVSLYITKFEKVKTYVVYLFIYYVYKTSRQTRDVTMMWLWKYMHNKN